MDKEVKEPKPDKSMAVPATDSSGVGASPPKKPRYTDKQAQDALSKFCKLLEKAK